ncbi:MAG: 30S ribosomal protein S2, partial [Lachnospiraceae bacterium]|nr:30S ribosomal protein S2 [Lachnospiraceae bacterium]
IVAKMADAVIEANQGAENYVEEAEAEKIEETDEVEA